MFPQWHLNPGLDKSGPVDIQADMGRLEQNGSSPGGISWREIPASVRSAAWCLAYFSARIQWRAPAPKCWVPGKPCHSGKLWQGKQQPDPGLQTSWSCSGNYKRKERIRTCSVLIRISAQGGRSTDNRQQKREGWVTSVILMISPELRHSFLLSSSTVFMFSIHKASTGPSNMYHFLLESVATVPRRMSVEKIPSVLKGRRKAGLGPLWFCWNKWQSSHHKRQSYPGSSVSLIHELQKGPPHSFFYWDTSQYETSQWVTPQNNFFGKDLEFMSFN